MRFEHLRSPLGKSLYQLEYRGHGLAAGSITDTVVCFLAPKLRVVNALVAVPASTARAVQPMPILA